MAPLFGADITKLQQQLIDSEASRAAAAYDKKIAELEDVVTQREIAHRNAIAKRDEARDIATSLQKKLDLKKKRHEEEALCHEEEIKKLRESRDGLDKSFRDTSSALNAL